LAAEMLLVKIIHRAKHLINKGEQITAAATALDFFLHQATPVSFIGDHLDTFCCLDDHDVMATIKNWCRHPDKILSALCRSLIERRLYKVKLQADPIDTAFYDEKKKDAINRLSIDAKDVDYFVFTGTTSNTTYNPSDERI